MRKNVVFAEYASYHRDPRNRLCHCIGIPLIVLGLMGLMSFIRLGPINLAVILAAATLVFYATIEVRAALISGVVFIVLYSIGLHLTWTIDVAAFVAGWVLQLVGHRLEGNKPKFLENLTYLLIGPLYMFEQIVLGSMGGKPASR